MREIPEILRGFSDPPNYRPAQGGRLDDLDPFADLPRYRLALESMVRMAAGRAAVTPSLVIRTMETACTPPGSKFWPIAMEDNMRACSRRRSASRSAKQEANTPCGIAARI